MIRIANSILLILILCVFACPFASAAAVAEFTDHQYNYAFQYPADWKMKPPPAKQKDDLGEVRVFIQGPRAALTLTVGHIGKSVNESQFRSNPDSERIVKMLIDLSIDRYKQMSKTMNANQMTVLESKVMPSPKGIKFYISTIHFIEGKPPIAMIATHIHPFDKPYGIIFLMSILADKKMKDDQKLYDNIFSSFHLLGEPPLTK